MSETLTIALVAGGCAAILVLAAAGILAWEASHRDLVQRVRRIGRLEDAARTPRGRNPATIMLGVVGRLGEALRSTSMFSASDLSDLERSARAAGFDPRRAIPIVMGGKILLMVACPVLAYGLATLAGHDGLTRLMITVLAVVVGMLGPNWLLNWSRRSHAAALRRGLPDALDLLVVCAEAGLGLETAVDRVAMEMRPSSLAVAQEFSTLGQELRLSSDRRGALARMGERTGLKSFQRLGGTLSQTMRYGTPLGQALRILAADLRVERMMRLEERAAKLPALLTLPLILFILPCLFIVLVGPAAIQTLNMLSR